MKTQTLIILTFLLTSSIVAAKTNYSDLFSYDAQKITEEFAELTEIEQLVESGQSDFEIQLYMETNLPYADFQMTIPGDDFPPFIIGCCLGPIGVGVLIAAGSDNEDVVRSVFGCIVPSGLFALGLYTGDPFLIEIAIDLATYFLDY